MISVFGAGKMDITRSLIVDVSATLNVMFTNYSLHEAQISDVFTVLSSILVFN